MTEPANKYKLHDALSLPLQFLANTDEIGTYLCTSLFEP